MEVEAKTESILDIAIKRIQNFFVNLQITLRKLFCCTTVKIVKELSVSEIELKDILKEKPVNMDTIKHADICMISNTSNESLILNENDTPPKNEDDVKKETINEDDVNVIIESEKIKIFENFSRTLVEMMDEKNKEFAKENGRGMTYEEIKKELITNN